MTDLEIKKEQIAAQLEFLTKLVPMFPEIHHDRKVYPEAIDVEFHEVKPEVKDE